MRRALLLALPLTLLGLLPGCRSENYNSVMKQALRKFNELRQSLVGIKNQEALEGGAGSAEKALKELKEIHENLLTKKFDSEKLQARAEKKYRQLLNGVIGRVESERSRIARMEGGQDLARSIQQTLDLYRKLGADRAPEIEF